MKQKKLIYLYVLQDATNLFEIIIHWCEYLIMYVI